MYDRQIKLLCLYWMYCISDYSKHNADELSLKICLYYEKNIYNTVIKSMSILNCTQSNLKNHMWTVCPSVNLSWQISTKTRQFIFLIWFGKPSLKVSRWFKISATLITNILFAYDPKSISKLHVRLIKYNGEFSKHYAMLTS